MDPTTISLLLARDLVKKMLTKDVSTVTVTDSDAPDELKELANRLAEGTKGAKTWVFTDHDLESPQHTLAIHSYPWGPVEATLSTTTPEPEQRQVDAAISSLRSLKF